MADAALHQGGAMVLRQVRQHELAEVPVIPTDLLRTNLFGRVWYSGSVLASNGITYEWVTAPLLRIINMITGLGDTHAEIRSNSEQKQAVNATAVF